MVCIMWTLLGCFVISTVKASQLVVPSHVVRQGEVEADVGDRVLLRCLGGSLGWEGGEDGRYEEVEEAGSATSITIPAAKCDTCHWLKHLLSPTATHCAIGRGMDLMGFLYFPAILQPRAFLFYLVCFAGLGKSQAQGSPVKGTHSKPSHFSVFLDILARGFGYHRCTTQQGKIKILYAKILSSILEAKRIRICRQV